MRPLAFPLVATLLVAPVAGSAEEPAAAPAPASPAATPTASPPAAAPAPASATAVVATLPQAPASPPPPEYSSYVALKGGWFGSSGDFQGDDFSGSGTWELAVGTGRVFGVELASGSMSTSAGGLKVKTIPVLLSLRLQFPVTFVAPFLELGAGAYYNEVKVGGAKLDGWTAGWHAGLGCDLHFGRLLAGAQARYMGISPTFSTVGELKLDRYELLLRGGVLF